MTCQAMCSIYTRSAIAKKGSGHGCSLSLLLHCAYKYYTLLDRSILGIISFCIRQSLLVLLTIGSCRNCLSSFAKASEDTRFCSHLRWAESAEESPDTRSPIWRTER